MPSSLRLALLLAMFYPAVSPVLAQSCQEALPQAEKSYGLGLFEDVSSQLEPCFARRGISRGERVQALALRAKAFLAMDQPEPARPVVAEILRLDPSYEAGSPPAFVRLVGEVRKEGAKPQVFSLSRRSEALREAPGNVTVITAEEIARRGYLDLEAVLHDVPGLDIARGNGEIYSNISPQGFRASGNDRLLFLVDGVEQNEIGTNTAYLSRQYPLADIERVEVVLGPLSALYGPGAYSGVVHVITRSPASLLAQGRRYGGILQATSGDLGTQAGDLVLAGQVKDGSLGWALTARTFRSDGYDLSGFSDWDHRLQSFDYRQAVRLTGKDAEDFCFFQDDCKPPAGYDGPLPYEPRFDESGRLVSVELTDYGEALAREADARLFSRLRFADSTRNRWIHGRLWTSGLVIGFQSWSNREGSASWYRDLSSAVGEADEWSPQQTAAYLQYSRSFGPSFTLDTSSRYLETHLDPERSRRTSLFFYGNGMLDLTDLALGGPPFKPREGSASPELVDRLSSRSRSEVRLSYEPSGRLFASASLDFAQTSVHGNRLDSSSRQVPEKRTAWGFQAQTSYELFKDLELYAAGRLDQETVRIPFSVVSGPGDILSSRLAAVYTPGPLVFKAAHSTGFLIPAVEENRPLRAETVRQTEISAGWQPRERAFLELSAYEAEHGQRFGFLETEETSYRVRGFQLSGARDFGPLGLSGSYTETRTPVPGIARRRANLALDVPFGSRFGLDLRWRYTGERTFPTAGAYQVADLTLTSRLFSDSALQLIVNNILDEGYADPGLGLPDPRFALQIPQPGRTVFLRLTQGLPGKTAANSAVASAISAGAFSCDRAVEVARKAYEAGRFEDVQRELDSCTKGPASRSSRIQAQALLAQTFLVLDDLGAARGAAATLLRIDPTFEAGPSPRFARLVEEVRQRESETRVGSVSKSSESLREAPATVVVVTAEEIERRGYLDLEDLLHDLPGFDISRGNGEIYSNIYQRGFRSNNSDRNLLLLDGVEQNDLSANVAYLSRQFPLSNIDRVEVVYGPASTMYGANAYTGVINIISREPEALLDGGGRFGARMQAAAGSFGTGSADLTLAGQDRDRTLAWTMTGRMFESDEQDLSRFSLWDYDYSDVDYQASLRLMGREAQFFCARYNCLANPLLSAVVENGQIVAVGPSEAGARLALEQDSRFVRESALRFSDPTRDWFWSGRVRLSSFTLGFQTWFLDEGTAPWFTDVSRPGKEDGSRWAPGHTTFYLKYSRSLGEKTALQAFSRYVVSDLDERASASSTLNTYASGGGRFRGVLLAQLIDCRPQCSSTLEEQSVTSRSTQIANELTLILAPTQRWNLVSGLEARKSSIQGELLTPPGPGPVAFTELSLREHTDYAFYTQASFQAHRLLKLVAGGRFDYNEIDLKEGSGGIFNSRAAVIYTPGPFTFKAIYSEGFKDPSDFEKFSTLENVRDFASPDLRPETVENFEISAGWKPDAFLSLDAAFYEARYHGVVGVGQRQRSLGGVTSQYQNLNDLRIRGLQMNATWRAGQRLSLFGNYTYTEPLETEPRERRIGDIASHRANLGIDTGWRKLDADLRLRYVGARKTGAETTVTTNPFDQIDAYLTAHATLGYRDILPGTTLQLIVNNLFDAAYDHPGVQEAGNVFAARLPQPGRTFHLRLLYSYGASRGRIAGQP